MCVWLLSIKPTTHITYITMTVYCWWLRLVYLCCLCIYYLQFVCEKKKEKPPTSSLPCPSHHPHPTLPACQPPYHTLPPTTHLPSPSPTPCLPSCLPASPYYLTSFTRGWQDATEQLPHYSRTVTTLPGVSTVTTCASRATYHFTSFRYCCRTLPIHRRRIAATSPYPRRLTCYCNDTWPHPPPRVIRLPTSSCDNRSTSTLRPLERFSCLDGHKLAWRCGAIRRKTDAVDVISWITNRARNYRATLCNAFAHNEP